MQVEACRSMPQHTKFFQGTAHAWSAACISHTLVEQSGSPLDKCQLLMSNRSQWTNTRKSVAPLFLVALTLAQFLSTLRGPLPCSVPFHHTGFTDQGLSNTAWAYAKLEVYAPDLMGAISERTALPYFLQTFSPQAVTNIVWAFATLGIQNQYLMARVAQQIMQDGFLYQFNSQAVANIAWAFGKLGIPQHNLMAEIASRCMQNDFLYTFTSQAISNLAWAFATLGIHNEMLMAGIAKQVCTWG